MNAFQHAKLRAFKERAAYEKELMDSGYDAVAACYPGRKLRTREEYYNRLKECEACCPSGICEECGCMYKAKLALRAFTCGKGKFKND